MLIGARNTETLWAVNESTFTTSAANIIQNNWANTKTKVETDESYCICWRVPIKDPSHSFIKICFLPTLSFVPQLSTHHSRICVVPIITTHSTPCIVDAYLHSAFIWKTTSHQSKLTRCARNYITTIILIIITATILFQLHECTIMTLISSEDSAHDFIVKFSPSVCVAVVTSLTREVTVQSFVYHAYGKNPAVINGHDKTSNYACSLRLSLR